MTTFCKIVNKVIKLDNNIFAIKHYENDNISGIHKFYFNYLINNLLKNYKKFHLIEEIMNNFYFSQKQNEKEELFNLFCKIQTIYHKLNRFVFLCKYKRSKLIVDNDLQLNQIKKNQQNIICIYHINSKYLFKIDELLKIIYMSLTNNCSFFSEPISIKNPYNNIPFGKSILYFIYIYLVLNTKIMFIKPEYLDVFLKFKKCNFDITMFVDNYEYILREYSLQNYLNNSTKKTILDDIKLIIDSFNSNFSNQNKKIKIDEEFPENILIKTMKPYLYLYLVYNYSLVQENKIRAKKNFYNKMYEFQRFNPRFGKKNIILKDIIKNGKIKKIKSHIEFDTKHKKFNTYESESFMVNHLSYKYEIYSDEESDDEHYVTEGEHELGNIIEDEHELENVIEDEEESDITEDEHELGNEELEYYEENNDDDSIS